MKKIVFLLIDIVLLFGAVSYSLFNGKKVVGQGWSKENSEKTILLASGPSLKIDIEKVLKDALRSEVYVLNYFAATEYFRQIEPEYYVLTDRIFWSKNTTRNFKKDNEKLFKYLDEVDWNMNIICPSRGYKWISERLAGNKFIRVIKINSVNIEFKSESINLFALNRNLITPHFINGFVMVLWHAISRNRTNIEIYGADFSLFKEYFVDQKTNELFNSAPHFYENSKALEDVTNKYPDEPKKMLHERLFQQWSSFYQMYLLSEIAKKRNIKITNLSSNSFLDCFDRSK
tara:strand:+ start:35227 stop:36090 length:864 start_codon:yes stop_codon:yes gene_type:complete